MYSLTIPVLLDLEIILEWEGIVATRFLLVLTTLRSTDQRLTSFCPRTPAPTEEERMETFDPFNLRSLPLDAQPPQWKSNQGITTRDSVINRISHYGATSKAGWRFSWKTGGASSATSHRLTRLSFQSASALQRSIAFRTTRKRKR